MKELKDYYPINRDAVKARWDEIMNIPNDQWETNNVERTIMIVNNKILPATLRTVKLNMLPVLVISILDDLTPTK